MDPHSFTLLDPDPGVKNLKITTEKNAWGRKWEQKPDEDKSQQLLRYITFTKFKPHTAVL